MSAIDRYTPLFMCFRMSRSVGITRNFVRATSQCPSRGPKRESQKWSIVRKIMCTEPE